MAGVDYWRRTASAWPEGAHAEVRVWYRHIQVPGFQRSKLGLLQVRPDQLEKGHRARGDSSQCDQSGSLLVQVARWKTDPLAWMGRRRSHAARQHSLSRAG